MSVDYTMQKRLSQSTCRLGC